VPASKFINVDCEFEIPQVATVNILDINGRTIFNSTEASTKRLQKSYFLPLLAHGIYILQLRTADAIVARQFIAGE